MPALVWDASGTREFETGVDKAVLFVMSDLGVYGTGVAWSGLIGVTETPSGAEATAQYADNQKYLELVSAENFGGTIEAFMYPDEFMECDGLVEPTPGLSFGQQGRKTFALAYRTKVGNDTVGQDFGYKIHIVYGMKAQPAERAYKTVNDSPEAMTFSWTFTTTPVNVDGHKPTAIAVIDSTQASAASMTALEKKLWGDATTTSGLPTPNELIAMIVP